MSKRRKKKRSLADDAHQPSASTVAMLLRGGGGAHRESLAERNKRTGRLRGAEKRNVRTEDDD